MPFIVADHCFTPELLFKCFCITQEVLHLYNSVLLSYVLVILLYVLGMGTMQI